MQVAQWLDATMYVANAQIRTSGRSNPGERVNVSSFARGADQVGTVVAATTPRSRAVTQGP